MNKKDSFIKSVSACMTKMPEEFNQDSIDYFNILKTIEEPIKPEFTENGARVLKAMQEHRDEFKNLFKAKELAETTDDLSAKTIAGAARKLIADGYVEKVITAPTIVYGLTEKGMKTTI